MHTGLSFEVPSLRGKVVFQPAPLLYNIDTSAFEPTRCLHHELILIIKAHHKNIFKYLETGLNVPVDCSEISQYIINENIEDFIEKYNCLLAKSE